tara:strand:+ start:417 stop:938 length:522 start_codon:yes stop_codon:yes gene_type:complete
VKNFFFFLFFLTILNINVSYSQTIYYADIDKIIKESVPGKKIFTHFEYEQDKFLDEVNKFQVNINKQEQEIISQKNILDQAEYIKKINLLRKDIDVFNQKNNKKINENKLSRDKTIKSLMKEINNILKEFAEKNNIDIILSSNQMLIGKSNLDLTNNILEIVNDKIKKIEIQK